MDAYLILADGKDVEVMAVYIGKQPGAEKALAALRHKHEGLGYANWRVAPIEVVDTFGARR